MVAVPAQFEPLAAPEPALRSCLRCGAALTPGRRFCKQCGRAVNSKAPVSQVKAVPSGQGGQATVLDLPPEVPASGPAEIPVSAEDASSPVHGSAPPEQEPDVALHANDELAAASISEPEELRSPLPLSPPLTAAFPAPPEPLSVSSHQRKVKMGLAIGITAAVLVATGGFLAWHFYSHPGVSSSAAAPQEPEQITVTPPAQNQNQQTTATPEQQRKPAPGIAENPAPAAPQSQSGSGTSPVSPTLPTNPPQRSDQYSATLTPQPEPGLPPVTPPQPPVILAPRSGILHYQGPPVPHNGTVVFDNLPQARLKFNFDHQAWSLIIKANRDGTKKVTLISQAPGYQTTCDLGWEIVE